MKKIFLIFITVLLLALYYTLNLSLPTTKEVHFPQNNIKENILLVPLDSRPVCSTMVKTRQDCRSKCNCTPKRTP